MHETQLTHTRQTVVEKHDFSTEIRGQRDIATFVANSEVLLDLPETELELIVDRLLDAMLSPESHHKISTISAKR